MRCGHRGRPRSALCHEPLALVLEVMDQVMAVGAEPGEVIEAVVAAVFVEVVDGEEALVREAAAFADLGPTGAEHRIAVDTVTALPVRMLLAGSLPVVPACPATIAAEKEAAPRILRPAWGPIEALSASGTGMGLALQASLAQA